MLFVAIFVSITISSLFCYDNVSLSKMALEAEGQNTHPQVPPMQTVSLSRKKRIRGGYRAHVSKLISDAKKEVDDGNSNILAVEHLISVITEKRSILRKADEEIFSLISNDEVESEVLQCEDLLSDIQKVVVALEAKRASLQHCVLSEPQSLTRASEQSQESFTKLPKLHLSKYHGDPKKWTEWWDTYEVIHGNKSLAPVDKFRHLRTLLEGQAASAIAGLKTTGANYNEAISILKDRFAQKQIIINSHMEVLLNIRQVSSSKDVSSMRKLFDTIETNVRSLKALGIDFEQYGTLLLPIVMAKLPEEFRLAITKSVKKDEWNLEKVLEVFKAELEAREQCGQLEASNPTGSSRQTRNAPFATAALLTNENKITCSFCKHNHPSAKCNIVTELKARLAIIKGQGRCFVCLKKGHLSRNCTSKIKCYFCKQRHHASLCESNPSRMAPNQVAPGGSANPLQWQQHSRELNHAVYANPEQSQRNVGQFAPNEVRFAPAAQRPHSSDRATTTMYVDARNSVLLQTASGYISSARDAGKIAVARMIFDSGSQRSYISQRLKDSLALPTLSRDTLTIKKFGTEESSVETCDVTQFCVRSPYNNLTMYVTAYVLPIVCAPVSNQPLNLAVAEYSHLRNLPLADFKLYDHDELDIDILIGLDFYWMFFTGCSRRGENGGPVALESQLGWILSGNVQNCPERSMDTANLVQTHVLRVSDSFLREENEDETLIAQLSKYWNLESIGITKNEETVYQRFSDDIKFVDGRYVVNLPWKEEHPVLPDNYGLCRRRLDLLFKKLDNNSDLLREYDAIIKDQEKRGIIERVYKDQESLVGKTHYLPHHPVVRQDKETTKVRVVYDASASTTSGTSLNNCLYPGPCLLKTVGDIITRFRLFPIALTADIEKAFLMIAVEKSDCDVLRFLWYDDINERSSPPAVYRFRRIVFGVTSSPFILNATLKHHLENYEQVDLEIITKLLNSLYADDINTGGYSENEVVRMYQVSKAIMKDGGFNLRKWQSNSPRVMQDINQYEITSPQSAKVSLNEDDQSYAKSTFEKDIPKEMTRIKVLGLSWDKYKDNFFFPLAEIANSTEQLAVTKRNVLKTTAKFFDPIGLITPITTQLKVFMQEVFKREVAWDDLLPTDLEQKWSRMLADLRQAQQIFVARCYFPDLRDRPDKLELIGFCDSSERAYAACVYIRITSNGQTSVSLVASKSRVAPLNKVTIPRLELLACLLLSRLISSLKDSLQPLVAVDISRCYTDSIVALCWIKGMNREWKIFVENRVQEIRNLVVPSLWSHCPGQQNPADIPTREINPVLLQNKVDWWKGPKWLVSDLTEWPSETDTKELPENCIAELKSEGSNVNVALLVQANSITKLKEVIKLENFSSYRKLLRVLAYVLRFIANCKGKSEQKKDNLTADELDKAELLLVQDAQCTIPHITLEKLSTQLGIYRDEHNVLRCKGRLSNASLRFDTRRPILLPREHHLSVLIIQDCHNKVMHNGTKETLLELRSRFWITRGRQLVKKVIHPCKTCKLIQGPSYSNPPSSQLPDFRVTTGYSFEAVGIDFAGPLFVKSNLNGTRKVYLALFTCARTRAVHLEIVPDLSTETFMLCLKRFINRRGMPRLIITDNAKTFKSASKQLSDLFQSRKFRSFLADQRIHWKFNLAKAPWWGGFYERLIKSIKLCLKKCIGKANLTYDELSTEITNVEAVLNSRPLTYMYPDDLAEPLTPSHLLSGRRLLNLPELPEIDSDEEYNERADSMRKRQRYVSRVFQHYWQRWKKEYLVSLREYHQIREGTESEIGVGHVVLIENELKKNRLSWKLGRVVELITGKDAHVRGARVKMANGNIIERPVQRLYPLEMSDSNTVTESKQEAGIDQEDTQKRPQRKAARIANERIQIIDQLEKYQ